MWYLLNKNVISSPLDEVLGAPKLWKRLSDSIIIHPTGIHTSKRGGNGYPPEIRSKIGNRL